MDDRERVKALIDQLKDLKLQEQRVISELESINDRNGTGRAPTEVRFAPGDRVVITNHVRKPAIWNWLRGDWDPEKERLAVVTKVTEKQVHLLTDNGSTTWRAPKNLRRFEG